MLFNEIIVRMIKLIIFMYLYCKFINVIILYYICFIIEKLKIVVVYLNDCREMKFIVKGK